MTIPFEHLTRTGWHQTSNTLEQYKKRLQERIALAETKIHSYKLKFPDPTKSVSYLKLLTQVRMLQEQLATIQAYS